MNTNLRKTIEKSIRNGFDFLCENQKQAGNFIGYAFTIPDRSVKPNRVHETISPTPFTTSLILNALRPLQKCEYIDQQKLHKLAELGTDFIYTEIDETYFAWNYWEKKEPLRKTLPADMDDTSLAFAAIKYWRPETVDGESLARLIHTLLATERKEGGPYNTWITDFKKDKRFDDCDIGVNANIAYMLSLLDIRLNNLEIYFEKAVETESLTSLYYISPLVMLYFIARGYKGDKRAVFIEAIRKHQKPDGTWGSIIDTAVSLSALAYLGEAISHEEKALGYIVASQKHNHWQRDAFYFERGDKETKWYHGAATLTTSLCLEALCLAAGSTASSTVPETRSAQMYAHETDEVVRQCIASAKEISEEFALYAKTWSAKIMSHPWIRESVMVPFFLSAMLKPSTQQTDTQLEEKTKTLLKLSHANLSGWIGYSMMDDVMDGDAPPSLIPFANFCLRAMNTMYAKHFNEDNFTIVSNLLSETDKAYATEAALKLAKTENGYSLATIPDPEKICGASKSIGQVIACLGVLQEIDADGKSLISFYRHFLEAKQMNDDAEDLIEDLSLGRMTKIGAMVLSAYKKRKAVGSIDVPSERETLLDIFWNDIFDNVYTEIIDNLHRAEVALSEFQESNTVLETNHFLHMISKLRKSIDTTNVERETMRAFIKAYAAS
jgi:hypothetical protein